MIGSQDFSSNPQIIESLQNYESSFHSQKPLFNVEDISFPLSTSGIKIVDSTGKRVKLAGTNWSGAHLCRHCVDGLECRPMKDICWDIRYKFKMNCVRLTYSLQLFTQNSKVDQKFLTANPQLVGLTSIQIFDKTIQKLTQLGLMVILNNHNSTSMWCCSQTDGDGLWWTKQFPQEVFFAISQLVANRYKHNPRVIGLDVRNQIRGANGIFPTWGDGNPQTDWKRAAQISSQKVLSIAPHWLIMIGGLNYQLDFTGVYNHPIKLSVPNKLVYTGHIYGFSWGVGAVAPLTYEQFKTRYFNQQTYVRALGVPYLLGQFGNDNNDKYWTYLMAYLKETDIDWTYWCLDGFKDKKEDQTFGLYTYDFYQPRHPSMLNNLWHIGHHRIFGQ